MAKQPFLILESSLDFRLANSGDIYDVTIVFANLLCFIIATIVLKSLPIVKSRQDIFCLFEGNTF